MNINRFVSVNRIFSQTARVSSNYLYRNFQTHMASVSPNGALEEYEMAIQTLNTLQSNATKLEINRKLSKSNLAAKLEDMREIIQRCGIPMHQVDSLPVIHVSGTQGKGSTCAMIESILRAQGLKTGFFSSPHLIEVRERIRLNGEPLSLSAFTSHFWSCYNRLLRTMDEYDGQMPFYFSFLTLMSLDVFISERPDVCIMEVGIGGEFDCTNIFKSPQVCGVTSLGHDHTELLGESIEEIAWNKAGIFKSGTPCYVQYHSPSVHQVYLERAKERNVKELYLIPALSPYGLPRLPKLSLQGEFQYKNAALAIQIANKFLSLRDSPQPGTAPPLLQECGLLTGSLSPDAEEGLMSTSWAGRAQIVEKCVPNLKRVVFYLDGAHTPEALECAIDWFQQARHAQQQTTASRKGIVLNLTGSRKHSLFLEKMRGLDLDYVFFCPNISQLESTRAPDTVSVLAPLEQQQSRCQEIERHWKELRTGDSLSQSVSSFSEVFESLPGSEEGGEYHILVTGSLYLVSAALQFLK